MKKISAIPMLLAIVLVGAKARQAAIVETVSFEQFLSCFKTQQLPYKITLKSLEEEAKKEIVPGEESLMRHIEPILAQYIPMKFSQRFKKEAEKIEFNGNPNRTFSVERGYDLYRPLAKIETPDFYIVSFSKHFLGYSYMSEYYLSIFDKSGKHLLTTPFANYFGSHRRYDATEVVLKKNFDLVFKFYVRANENSRKLKFKQKETRNLLDLITIENSLREKKLEIKPDDVEKKI